MARTRRWIWLAMILGVASTLGVLGWHFAPRLLYAKYGYLALKETPDQMSAQQRADVARAAQGLKALVAFSSSRSGNHEIYLLGLPDMKLFRLTNNDRVDYFPRFSPDGKRLSLARSKRVWVSERDMEGWDAWIVNLEDNSERLAAHDANYPQWVDNDRLSFLRGRQVVVKDIKSGAEKVIYDADRSPVAGMIVTPELCPGDDNTLAITARGKLDGVFLVDLAGGGHRSLGAGCELTWFPDGHQVMWVDNGGQGGNRVLRSPWQRSAPEVFMDLPGGHSHEYFTRLSRDGKWLVWGASAGEHEHDVADYEIFLWRVGTPWESAVRLTHNQANERWPDILILP